MSLQALSAKTRQTRKAKYALWSLFLAILTATLYPIPKLEGFSSSVPPKIVLLSFIFADVFALLSILAVIGQRFERNSRLKTTLRLLISFLLLYPLVDLLILNPGYFVFRLEWLKVWEWNLRTVKRVTHIVFYGWAP